MDGPRAAMRCLHFFRQPFGPAQTGRPAPAALFVRVHAAESGLPLYVQRCGCPTGKSASPLRNFSVAFRKSTHSNRAATRIAERESACAADGQSASPLRDFSFAFRKTAHSDRAATRITERKSACATVGKSASPLHDFSVAFKKSTHSVQAAIRIAEREPACEADGQSAAPR